MFKHDKVETALAIAGVVILSLIAVASVAAVKVTQEPYPQACVDEAVATLGATPKVCNQRITIEGVCEPVAPRAQTVVTETRTDLDVDADGKQTKKPTTITHVFTDVGPARARLCPGSTVDWYTEQEMLVGTTYPDCPRYEYVADRTCP